MGHLPVCFHKMLMPGGLPGGGWALLEMTDALLFSRELSHNHINFSPNALTVQTAKKSQGESLSRLCHGRCVGVTLGEKPEI